jgi:hypothetical protein
MKHSVQIVAEIPGFVDEKQRHRCASYIMMPDLVLSTGEGCL